MRKLEKKKGQSKGKNKKHDQEDEALTWKKDSLFPIHGPPDKNISYVERREERIKDGVHLVILKC